MRDRKRTSVSQTSVFEIEDRPQYLVLNNKNPLGDQTERAKVRFR